MYTDKQGRTWYKGNLHMHTTVTDGRRTPEEAYRLYREAGYDFVARTDHWQVSEGGRFEDMLLLPGVEYDVGNRAGEGIFHVVAVGVESAPAVTREHTVQQIIDRVHEAGGLAILAHPAWSLNTPEQLMALRGVDMTEIYNSVSGVPFNCRPYSGLILDCMAARGCLWKLAATDDVHFYTPTDTCRSYVMVRAEECSAEAILAALRRGDFYASQGPILDVVYEEGQIRVACSPVEEIVYYTDSVYTGHRCVQGCDLTADSYTPIPADTFVRVEVRDSEGRYAWSPYFTVRGDVEG